ncbi:MAG: hypothetical protein QXL94_01690 [Candidatus Parvarchaeum sp.]
MEIKMSAKFVSEVQLIIRGNDRKSSLKIMSPFSKGILVERRPMKYIIFGGEKHDTYIAILNTDNVAKRLLFRNDVNGKFEGSEITLNWRLME